MTQQEKQLTKTETNSKDFIVGAIIGGAIGAATALFLAPKSGSELRNDLNTQAVLLKERSNEWKDQAVTKSSEFATTAKVKSAELSSIAKEKSAEFSQSVQAQSNALVEKIKSYKGDLDADSNVEEETFGSVDSTMGAEAESAVTAVGTATPQTQEIPVPHSNKPNNLNT
ncbi:YtxH domain-containing protein [Jeotgalibacillus marinus]|uniref:YtxH domain-containing protein n=1 Tax=Jeotgalibacillus marinus TaxID=86667 RepID=A0ABV3Q0F3_9BACL